MTSNANPPAATRSRLLLLVLFAFVAISTNQLDYDADHQQIVEGAGDILSYYAMSEAAPELVTQRVPYHHAQRIFLPYTLGLVSRATGQSVQLVYLVAGTLLLLAAFWCFVRCCELAAMTESTRFLVACMVLFNPYVFRHFIMFNGYINDIGFLAAMSFCLLGILSRKRGWLLAAIIFAALSRQTTLFTIPAWFLLEFLIERPRKLKIDWMSASYVILPVLIYLGTSWIATRSGIPSETRSALFGIFDWMQSSFSLGRLISFAIRGIIPFAFLISVWWGLRRSAATDTSAMRPVLGLWMLVFSICIQPVLGGPDWTTNSIARLNALAVFPAALAVGIAINGAVDRLSVKEICTVAALIVLGSIHHIYTFNGTFSADKNMWFAALNFLAAAAAGIVLRSSSVSPGFVPHENNDH